MVPSQLEFGLLLVWQPELLGFQRQQSHPLSNERGRQPIRATCQVALLLTAFQTSHFGHRYSQALGALRRTISKMAPDCPLVVCPKLAELAPMPPQATQPQ